MMNKKSFLSVIYGIAVFAAFVSAVALVYGAIETLCNTTFTDYDSIDGDGIYNYTYYPSEIFYTFQLPLGRFLLITAIVAIAGSVCSFFAVFGKKSLVKIVSSCIVFAVVFVAIAFLIAGANVWNTFYQNSWNEYNTYTSIPALILSSNRASAFAMYSVFMSSMVQVLAIFAAIIVVIICNAVILRKERRVATPDTEAAQDR
ncbi:MAG TPA: hypothetical protein IAB94_03930 [Candidatus Coproplasma avicola]|uniref:Uncharacterized protein n=1 Tax=Candidatus Coproplasma avicola TaxID=2840744 RepID=A0A9D1E6V2_9FIRM|nr:hypothetical protein [Candidatus Coproplasma avicola]